MARWRPALATIVGLGLALALAAVVVPKRQPDRRVTATGREAATGARPAGETASEAATATTSAAGGGTPVHASASGGGSETASPSGATASAASGGSTTGTASARGVTPTKVRVGIAVLDLSAVKVLGPEYDSGNVEQQWDALLDGWHRQHLLPVNGRDVEFVYQRYNVLSYDDQRSACQALVNDKKVFAVVAIEFFYQQGAECVAREFKTPLLTSEGPSEEAFARSAPNLFSLTVSTTKLLRNFVHWADARGLLTNRRIGIYHVEDAEVQRVVDQALKAELAKLHRNVVAEATTRNRSGGPEDALAVQKFRSERVDLALLMTSKGGFMQQAEAQGYKPRYLDSDYEGGTSDVGTNQFPTDQFDNTLAMTTLRRGEPAAGMPPSPDMEPCLRNYERYAGHKVARPGPGGHETAEWVFVVLSCDEGKVLLHALKAAGPQLTQQSFVAGLQSLRNVPLIRYPDVSFGPGRYEGVDRQRTLQWHANCTCWRATGSFEGLFVP